jgi:CHASE2 domain-containing sensor protein
MDVVIHGLIRESALERRRDWVIWAVVFLAGAMGFVLTITVPQNGSWSTFVGPLSGAAVGSGMGQLVRGWWRSRHAHADPRENGR